MRGSAGRSSGAIVCWSSAWTLATRIRAVPLRQAASAATRAAVSSATSSLRSYAGARRAAADLARLLRERRPRLEPRDAGRVPEPGAKLLRDPVADLGVARDPH